MSGPAEQQRDALARLRSLQVDHAAGRDVGPTRVQNVLCRAIDALGGETMPPTGGTSWQTIDIPHRDAGLSVTVMDHGAGDWYTVDVTDVADYLDPDDGPIPQRALVGHLGGRTVMVAEQLPQAKAADR